MKKETEIDTMQEQYHLPLHMAPGAPVTQTERPVRFVVRMTPEASAAIKAQAAELGRSANAQRTFFHACKVACGGLDTFPIGDSVGATLRGAMSVIDSVFDPLAAVKRPIHKVIDFVFDEGDGTYLSTKASKGRVEVKSGFRSVWPRRDEERLAG